MNVALTLSFKLIKFLTFITLLPASPCAAEFYEIWHMRSTHRHIHMWQIFSQSVQGLRSYDTPKLPFPIALQSDAEGASDAEGTHVLAYLRAEYLLLCILVFIRL